VGLPPKVDLNPLFIGVSGQFNLTSGLEKPDVAEIQLSRHPKKMDQSGHLDGIDSSPRIPSRDHRLSPNSVKFGLHRYPRQSSRPASPQLGKRRIHSPSRFLDEPDSEGRNLTPYQPMPRYHREAPVEIIMVPPQDKINWKRMFEDGYIRRLTDPKNGKTYLLDGYLGQGNYGVVFKAELQGTSVALKLMTLNSSDRAQSYSQEIMAYKYLSSVPQCQEHLVCLYDHFKIAVIRGSLPELLGVAVTELMDGDLKSLPVEDAEITQLMVSLFDGLAFIHGHGFAHQDIKPENVFRKGVGSNAIFKLGDFGLVCAQNIPDISSCHFGTGSPLYMSPYKLRHDHDKATVEAEQLEDIWSLGLTLYQIIFKSLPQCLRSSQTRADIAKLTQADIHAFLNVRTPYPRSKPPGLAPSVIIYLLTRMLQVDPWERWDILILQDYLLSNLTLPPLADGVSVSRRNMRRDDRAIRRLLATPIS
jgi:hypothetical protein